MKRKIYYYDTDMGGVVYHANYLNYFEEARTDELEKAGLSIAKLREDGCQIVVSHQEIFYKYPAFYGDILDTQANVVEMSPIRMVYEYTITNQDGRLLSQGFTTLVCVTLQGAPTPWPPYVKEKIPVRPKTINVRKNK